MANTTLSSIGGVIQGNWNDEFIIGAHGDGTAKAGWTVTVLATGQVRATDVDGNLDEMAGILLPCYAIDMDTAITAAQPCSVVIPQSGHLYGVYTADLGSAIILGEPMVFHATQAGTLDAGGNIEAEHVARFYKGSDDDTYNIVIWGA